MYVTQTMTSIFCYKLRFTCPVPKIKYIVKSMEVKEATHVVQDGTGDLPESLLNCAQSGR